MVRGQVVTRDVERPRSAAACRLSREDAWKLEDKRNKDKRNQKAPLKRTRFLPYSVFVQRQRDTLIKSAAEETEPK